MRTILGKFNTIHRSSMVTILPTDDLESRYLTRDGLSMIDSISSNDADILPAYLNNFSFSTYLYVYDNGALDIGTEDFTFSCWVKGESATSNKVRGIAGKTVEGSKIGRYGFEHSASGVIIMRAQSSETSMAVVSTVNRNDQVWHFLLMQINQTTKKTSFFIDNVQIGSDVDFTGTFPAMANEYGFIIGGQNSSAGSGFEDISGMSYSDVRIDRRILSSEEKTSLYNREFIDNPDTLYPLLGSTNSHEWDASGGDQHLTVVNPESSIKKQFIYTYGSQGSRYGLDYGYTEYKDGQGSSYIPYTIAGNPITDPPLPIGATKVKDHPGNLTKHNLCNSMVQYPMSFMDRSNTTFWGWNARSEETFYDDTDADTKKQWHISEHNNLLLQAWANTGYKGRFFSKISSHSYKERSKGEDFLYYSVDQTGNNYRAIVVGYCNDYVFTDTYENDDIYWKYDAQNINYIRDLKVLKYDSGTVYLSFDGGLTYPNSKAVAGLPEVIFAYIFASGNILFASRLKIYLSTDNLSTVNEITALDIAGSPFTATRESYFDVNGCKVVTIDSKEIKVWGTYATQDPTQWNNINVWYTVDDGVTVKSCFKFGVTLPTYGARHVHSLSYNQVDGSFIMNTGDGQNDCNWFKGVYDWDLDTWTWSFLVGGIGSVPSTLLNDTEYKAAGLGFYGDYVYWDSDGQNQLKYGLFRVLQSEITDNTKAERIYPGLKEAGPALFLDNGHALMCGGLPNTMHTTNDSMATVKTSNVYGLPENNNLIMAYPENTNGWFITNIVTPDESDNIMNTGGVLWVKLK